MADHRSLCASERIPGFPCVGRIRYFCAMSSSCNAVSGRPWFRALIPVGVFTAAYTMVAAIVTSRTSNAEFVLYMAVMLVIFGVVAWLHARISLHTAALWCLSFWGLAHMAGGLMPVPADWPIEGHIRVLYSWWIVPNRLKYDQVVHAYGFGVTTWVCWQGLMAAVRPARMLRPGLGVLLLCAAAGMGFGALNEIVEFIATLTVPETNVGGYVNTGWDLVSNAVGSGVAAVLIRVCHREKWRSCLEQEEGG